MNDPEELSHATAHALALDPELDRETAESVGRYLKQSAHRYQSNIWRTGGREYYRNKAGLCEDAPCCGCCNA